MSNTTPNEDWSISGDSLEIKSALKEVYDDLVETEKLFSNNYSLFCVGLVYGVLHNKQHNVKPNASFIKLFAISDPISKDVIDLIYRLLDDGRSKNEIWQEMLSIADGGILALNDIYKSNKNFRIPYILKESKDLWPKRALELYNTNLHNDPK